MRDDEFKRKLSELAELEPDDNPSSPLRISKLKFQDFPCKHCGKVIQQEQYYSRLSNFPCTHMKHKCLNCETFQHPKEKTWGWTSVQVTNYYRQKQPKK